MSGERLLSCPEVNRGGLLVAEASRWIGVREKGANRGPEVEAFQRTIDGVADGSPWCMAFVQFCLARLGDHDLFKSEHCLTVWNQSARELRLVSPEPGAIVIWRRKGTIAGHAGIVKEVVNCLRMRTIEGNTGPGPGLVREGDGVYEKVRPTIRGTGDLELVGFLWPWLS
jgi:hypothetical protein